LYIASCVNGSAGMKLFLSILVVLSASLKAGASFTFNNNCKQAYTDMMCLRFRQAEERIQSEKKQNPDNQAPYIIENYIDFLKVLIGEEEKDLNRLKANKEHRLQKLAIAGKDSPWFLYSQSLVYLQCGIARIKFGEYVNASLDINRAYRLLIDNKKKFPDFVMNKAGLGLLHSLIGTVPSKYRWATRSMNFEGTIPQGNAEIEQAYQQVSADPKLHFLLPETTFLLTFVTLNLSADIPTAVALAKKIEESSLSPLLNESPLLVYAFANIYARAGENDKVIILLTDCQRTAEKYPFHYLDYMLGIAKLNRLDADAYYPFLRFLGNFKGKNYIRSAYMHLAWYYLIHDDEKKYNTYIERIKLRGNDQVDNDREAFTFAEKYEKPDVILLKARLLFDGGYYSRAIATLENFTPYNKNAETEYTYRLGRIYHNWGKTGQAIIYYTQTIQTGEDSPHYYAANSALQLGLIYEKRKEYALARAYYSKVLDMDFEEYQFSLSNKAQAGLNRIKEN